MFERRDGNINVAKIEGSVNSEYFFVDAFATTLFHQIKSVLCVE